MAKEIVHEDFGEKIGGAKKDLWAPAACMWMTCWG